MSIMMNSAYAAQINDADKEFYAEWQAIEIYEMTEEEAAQNPGKTVKYVHMRPFQSLCKLRKLM